MLKRLTLVCLAVGPSICPVLASDLISVPTSAAGEMTLHENSSFDWSGFYAGVHGVGQGDATAGTQVGIGIQAGVNAQFDFYLLGAEVAVQGLTGGNVGNTSYGQVLGRAGLVVSDNALIYAAGGYGIDLGPTADRNALLGGGVELAITDELSVDVQYLHGFPIGGGDDVNQVTFGANFHF